MTFLSMGLNEHNTVNKTAFRTHWCAFVLFCFRFVVVVVVVTHLGYIIVVAIVMVPYCVWVP